MTSGIASKGVDLDSIFDPYQAGTTKARAAGLNVAGSDTSNRYANIIYGSAAAATWIESENADLSTLYAAKGTANYSLPINGQTYSADGYAASGLVTANVVLNINNAQYEFVGNGTGRSEKTWPYEIPAGVSQYTYKIDSGTLQPWTNIPSSGTFATMYSVSAQSTNQGTRSNSHTLTLYFGNGGTAIYSGTCTMTATADSGA